MYSASSSPRTLSHPSHRIERRLRRDAGSVGFSLRKSRVSDSTACRERISVESRAKSADASLHDL